MFSDYFAINLGEFNQEFFESLDGSRHIVSPTIATEKYYHTVYVEGENAGIVGFIPVAGAPYTGFVQIVLAPAYRGKGLIEKIYDRMIEIHGLKTLYATIDKTNTTSIRAHEKIGFKMLPEAELADLRNQGLLESYEVRMKLNT